MMNAVLFHCAVEQRLARQAHNLEVVGSIPTGAMKAVYLRIHNLWSIQRFFLRIGCRSHDHIAESALELRRAASRDKLGKFTWR